MPHKDPAQAKAYRAAKYQAMKADPVAHAAKLAAERARTKQPEVRARLNVVQRRAYAKNPEHLKELQRRSFLKRKYGLTSEDYDAMLTAQGSRCAICRGEEVTGNRFAVDHSHATGHVRGLLCTNCNQALGKFNDDPRLLQAAIDYLKENV